MLRIASFVQHKEGHRRMRCNNVFKHASRGLYLFDSSRAMPISFTKCSTKNPGSKLRAAMRGPTATSNNANETRHHG